MKGIRKMWLILKGKHNYEILTLRRPREWNYQTLMQVFNYVSWGEGKHTWLEWKNNKYNWDKGIVQKNQMEIL